MHPHLSDKLLFMADNIHIVGFSGSLRKGSFNTQLLHAAKEVLPEGMTMEIISFKDIPVYNGDDDIPEVPKRPDSVEAFRAAIAGADGILIVTPEYNYSIPGPLKNAIDWASRGDDSPLFHKPVALMGATPGMWGTTRSQLALEPVFHTLKMKPVGKPEVFVNNAGEKFKDGKLADEKTIAAVKKHLEAFKTLIRKSKA